MIHQVKEGITSVDQLLDRVVHTDVGLLQESSLHIIRAGGKRLRPQVVFLSYLAAGGTDISSAVPLAAAVELVHTATLVHDDINDHSPTRRGRVAVHARWGRTFALLTGDYLFTKVYEMMAPYGPDFNVVMADACVKLVEGETLQAATAKAGTIDQQTYKRIVTLKTASLFSAGAIMGAQLAHGTEKVVEALGNFGQYLGVAFQIVDDVLDVIGDPDTLGKPVGNDINQGAGAILAQNGRKHTDGSGSSDSEADPIVTMMAQLKESGAVEIALLEAREMASKALASLKDIPESPATEELASLVDEVLERQY
ncbi:MAG: polyprenyl synthetase family protein [Candidatus Promineifilaceae bacterium]